jgi:hypothetical protein
MIKEHKFELPDGKEITLTGDQAASLYQDLAAIYGKQFDIMPIAIQPARCTPVPSSPFCARPYETW